MGDEVIHDADGTPAPTPPPGPVATPTPPAPADDWQKRYTGLFQSFEARRTQLGYAKWDEVPPATTVQELTQKAAELATAQQTLEQRQAELATLSGEKTTLENELSGLKAAMQKTKLVADKAPALFGFLDEIPTKQDSAEQEAAITAFAQKLAQFTGGRNIPPPTPSPTASSAPVGATPNAQTLQAKMVELSRAGNWEEYARVAAEWRSARHQ